MENKQVESLEKDKLKTSSKTEEWDSLYDDSGECVKILEKVYILS
jgi:hypothetical protein